MCLCTVSYFFWKEKHWGERDESVPISDQGNRKEKNALLWQEACRKATDNKSFSSTNSWGVQPLSTNWCIWLWNRGQGKGRGRDGESALCLSAVRLFLYRLPSSSLRIEDPEGQRHWALLILKTKIVPGTRQPLKRLNGWMRDSFLYWTDACIFDFSLKSWVHANYIVIDISPYLTYNRRTRNNFLLLNLDVQWMTKVARRFAL